MTPSSNVSAEARKRRKEIIQSQRSENELVANGGTALASNGSTGASSAINGINGKNDDAAALLSNGTSDHIGSNGADKKPPKKRKVTATDSSSGNGDKNDGADDIDGPKLKKTQIRYDPDVPMSKDQLAAWRREARRVRNRESAAASRQRIRNRICELEDEVGEWKSKYSQALLRLEALERASTAKNAVANQEQDPPVLPSEEEQELNQEEPSDQPAPEPRAPIVALTEEIQDDAVV